MKKFKTTAAEVAFLIKAELKEKFPTVVFSVKSETYSGGNSVDVRYTATKTTPKIKEIEAVAKKYEDGYFDGMTDSYVYTNKTAGPTVRYIFVQAETTELKKEVLPEFLATWGMSPEEFQDQNAVMKKCGAWPDVVLFRFLTKNYI